MGVFSKFAAALVSIPSAVLGGMTTFLFASVATSGLRIISTVPFTRRNRFILAAAFAPGFGATLVPTYVYSSSLSLSFWRLTQSADGSALSSHTLVATKPCKASSMPSHS
jgi:xanthine/uracil permease